MTNTIKTSELAKEQIAEAVKASMLVTDAELGVRFSDHRDFVRIECVEICPFLCETTQKWVLFAANKEIVCDESENPFGIKTPVGWTGTFRRPSCYLGEVLNNYKVNTSSDCYSAITHTYKVPHKVFLDLLK